MLLIKFIDNFHLSTSTADQNNFKNHQNSEKSASYVASAANLELFFYSNSLTLHKESQ